jgi:hypothetical protein
MNFAGLLRAFDAAVALREVARRFRGEPPPAPPETGLTAATAPGITGQIEARLTNVVVAALKEAFDRDHARLELERAQLDEQRRRAEEALRQELRRQAADRELGRLRLLAATALVGWIASVVLLVLRLPGASLTARGVLASGWLLLLGALGTAFDAQRRVSAAAASTDAAPDAGRAGDFSMWLLVGGLALAAASLLF